MEWREKMALTQHPQTGDGEEKNICGKIRGGKKKDFHTALANGRRKGKKYEEKNQRKGKIKTSHSVFTNGRRGKKYIRKKIIGKKNPHIQRPQTGDAEKRKRKRIKGKKKKNSHTTSTNGKRREKKRKKIKGKKNLPSTRYSQTGDGEEKKINEGKESSLKIRNPSRTLIGEF